MYRVGWYCDQQDTFTLRNYLQEKIKKESKIYIQAHLPTYVSVNLICVYINFYVQEDRAHKFTFQ